MTFKLIQNSYDIYMLQARLILLYYIMQIHLAYDAYILYSTIYISICGVCLVVVRRGPSSLGGPA